MSVLTPSFKGLKFSLQEVSLSQVDRDPTQPRKTFKEESIRELAESIRENGGLIQLPVVKIHPECPDRFMIVAGERRIRALRLNGVERFFMNVVSGVTNTFRWSYVENLLREDLNYIEEAQAMKQNHDEGMTWEQVAALSGKSVGTVLKRVKLLELPDEIQQMIINGQLPSVERVLSLNQYRKTEKGQLIRMAHALIAGEELVDFGAQKLERRDRHVLRFMPGTPEGLLRRVLDFVWRTRGATITMRQFCKLPEYERREVWQKLESSTRKALLERAAELQDSIGAFLAVVRTLNSDSEPRPRPPQPQPPRPAARPPQPALAPRPAPIPTRPPQPPAVRVVAPNSPQPVPPVPPSEGGNGGSRVVPRSGSDSTARFAAPTRQPITMRSGQPPTSLRIDLLQKGRVERFGLVIRLLLENAERHSKVNLSKQRLRSVYVCEDPEETALTALRGRSGRIGTKIPEDTRGQPAPSWSSRTKFARISEPGPLRRRWEGLWCRTPPSTP